MGSKSGSILIDLRLNYMQRGRVNEHFETIKFMAIMKT